MTPTEPTPTRVFVTDHHVDAVNVTGFDRVLQFIHGHIHAEGITLDGDDPGSYVERRYNRLADLPPLGEIDMWPIAARTENRTDTILTVEPA